MSDGITDSNRMTLHDIEIWRQRTKEEFVSKLTTKELVEELCKREGMKKYVVPVGDYAYIARGKKPSLRIDGAAIILVMKE